RDLAFDEASKGPVAALNAVRRGGTVILAASMAEGLGSADFQHLLDRLRAGERTMPLLTSPGFFCIDQWMVQHLDQVLRRVALEGVSHGLSPQALRGLPLRRARGGEEGVAGAPRRARAPAPVALIPPGAD